MCKLPRYVFWLALLVCWPSILLADDEPTSTFVAQLGENKLYLYPVKCELGPWFTRWYKARWIFQGKQYEACWTLSRDESGIWVRTVDESGDPGSVPVQAFKKLEAI